MKTNYHENTVAFYYDKQWKTLERWWLAGETLGLHYAYYDKNVKNFKDAIYRMNELIGNILSLNDTQPKKILDAGCGVGGTSIYLAKKYPNVQFIGITIAPGQKELAQKFILVKKIKNVTVIEGDYNHTQFPDNYFDGVFALESISYTKNIQDFIKEMHRILKPGGRLVVIDGFQTGKQINPIIQKFYENYLRGRGHQQLTIPLLTTYGTYLKENGFTQIQIKDLSNNVARSLVRSFIIGLPFFLSFILKKIITLGTYNITKNFNEFSMGVSVMTPVIGLSNVARYYLTTAIKNERNPEHI